MNGCAFDWNAFADKYGIPGLLLAGIGLLVWFKVWPTFDKSLSGIVAHMGEIAKSLSDILPELKTMIDTAREHEANTRKSLEDLRALTQKTARRATK